MNNVNLFQLINAPPGLGLGQLALATLLAQWVIYLIPLTGVLAWVRGPRKVRVELLQVACTVLLALALAQLVAHVWPHPRPFVLHLGTQYLAHAADSGLPSDHVVAIWAVALAVLRTERFAIWGLPLLALGLVVGWCRVYLGVHFPLDVVAALPVAGVAVLMVAVLQAVLQRLRPWLKQRHGRSGQPPQHPGPGPWGV